LPREIFTPLNFLIFNRGAAGRYFTGDEWGKPDEQVKLDLEKLPRKHEYGKTRDISVSFSCFCAFVLS